MIKQEMESLWVMPTLLFFFFRFQSQPYLHSLSLQAIKWNQPNASRRRRRHSWEERERTEQRWLWWCCLWDSCFQERRWRRRTTTSSFFMHRLWMQELMILLSFTLTSKSQWLTLQMPYFFWFSWKRDRLYFHCLRNKKLTSSLSFPLFLWMKQIQKVPKQGVHCQ